MILFYTITLTIYYPYIETLCMLVNLPLARLHCA